MTSESHLIYFFIFKVRETTIILLQGIRMVPDNSVDCVTSCYIGMVPDNIVDYVSACYIGMAPDNSVDYAVT